MKNINRNELRLFLKNEFETQLNNMNGELANYIPELGKVNPREFSLCFKFQDGESICYTNSNLELTTDYHFTLQSLSKPLVYAMNLMDLGSDKVHEIVGVEPTGRAFNSIMELEHQFNRPYNPMVNSGAIALTSMTTGKTHAEKWHHLSFAIGKLLGSGHSEIEIDNDVFLSEKKSAHRNRSLAHLLFHFGHIKKNHDFFSHESDSEYIENCLDLYFKQCSIKTNVSDLANFGLTLSQNGNQIIASDLNRQILSIMFTCGMYDMSGLWAHQVGLPAKSGVSGGILSVIPGIGCIAIYSPLIDKHGSSVRGVEVMKNLSQKFSLSIFQ